MRQLIATLALFLMLCPAVAFAGGDPVRGAQLSKTCAICHSVTDGGNKIGPSLVGVFNRPAAYGTGFSYSTAMMDFAKTGAVWDERNLDLFLALPKALVPGTKMAFAGVMNAQDRADVIAYLASLQMGRPDKGKIVFEFKCSACHANEEREDRVGPHLIGLFTEYAIKRDPGFPYSPAMHDFDVQAEQWDDKSLDAFLKVKTSEAVPGVKMTFAGIDDPQDRADLIAYLKTLQ